ncbi:HAMP domain-containing sensor histidine kinase [Vagococcus fluvialis]|nr:HAMP domain-containing sensor histidine kinase [Vagococcus fluvialis]
MKNFFYTSVIIAIVSLVTLLTLYLWMPSYYENKLKSEATVKTEELIQSFEHNSLKEIKRKIETSIDFNYTYKLLDQQGKLMTESFPNTSTFFLYDNQKNPEDLTNEFTEKDITSIFPGLITQKKIFKDKDGNYYTLITEIYSQPISDAKMILLDLAPYIIGIALTLGMIAALFYSKLSTKRIRSVSDTTRKMLDFDQDVVCQINGHDEISDLANDINALNDTLKQAIYSLEGEISKRKELEKNKAYFVQSAAHELKTPVAIMAGLVEGMRLNIGKYQDHKTYLHKCQELLEQQTSLIREITSAYEISENMRKKHTLKKIQINEIIQALITPYELLTDQHKKRFLLNLSDIPILADQEDLTRILSNIISNAYRYSNDSSSISITYHEKIISVENKCPPLTSEVLSKIFEPFFRPDFSRNRNDGGSGLGLFFVKQLADFHDYQLRFESNKENNGMIFEIKLK